MAATVHRFRVAPPGTIRGSAEDFLDSIRSPNTRRAYGIAESLRAALTDSTDRDRQEVGAPVEQVLALLEEKCEILCELLYGCPWREALDSDSDRARIEAIMAALEHLLGAAEMDLPDRFLHHLRIAGQPFTLAVSSPEAKRFRDHLAFFQAVALELRRARASDGPGASDDVEPGTGLPRWLVVDRHPILKGGLISEERLFSALPSQENL